MSKLTIITVVYNAKADLELTLKSIKSQTALPSVIVVDGGSTDGTADVVKNYPDLVTKFISEKDKGIYDAMNKGIALSPGEWIFFLNAGDVFFDTTVVEKINAEISQCDVDILYGDVIIEGSNRFQLNCDVTQRVVHHQGIAYKKELHEKVGNYIVSKKVTIADYLFFNLIMPFKWKKLPFVFAICDGTGVSSKFRSFYMKICVDFLFGHLTIKKFTLMVVAYPFYKSLKSLLNFKSFYAK